MFRQIKCHYVLWLAILTLLAADASAATIWLKEAPAIPEVELIDQEGHSVRFEELIHGRVVLVNFMFTGCTSSCSPQTAILRAVQESISNTDGKNKILFISITVDPTTDYPARLSDYAQRFNLKLGVDNGWVFLTGMPQQVRRMLAAFGERGNLPETHTGLIWIGDQANKRWTRIAAFNGPKVLSKLIQEAVQW